MHFHYIRGDTCLLCMNIAGNNSPTIDPDIIIKTFRCLLLASKPSYYISAMLWGNLIEWMLVFLPAATVD